LCVSKWGLTVVSLPFGLEAASRKLRHIAIAVKVRDRFRDMARIRVRVWVFVRPKQMNWLAT